MDESTLPPILANAEEIDADPETARMIAEADEDIAASRFVRCYGEDEFDALLNQFAAQSKAS
ncbi:hypothetical protein [Frankia sp. Cppng1_Ct_nod]|uniref:hypothetical protein n=1 Tax=Frankia sp. Cppng1_Ct_nod TaxID=2897162 RepID=UPI00104145BB|nr:hypothetical protein [Frankia sp. Cppng1_Ct_nod]